MTNATPSRLAWTVHDRLRKARETAGMSQTELALAARIDRRTVGNYENGRVQTLDMRRLAAWAKATDVDLEWLAADVLDPAELAAGKVLMAMSHEYIYTRDVDDSAADTAAA